MQQPDRQARLQALLQRGERVVNAAHESPGLLEEWRINRKIEQDYERMVRPLEIAIAGGRQRYWWSRLRSLLRL